MGKKDDHGNAEWRQYLQLRQLSHDRALDTQETLHQGLRVSEGHLPRGAACPWCAEDR